MSNRKIGIVEVLRVSAHGSGLYLRIPRDVCSAFGIRRGDLLRVKIEGFERRAEGE